MGSGRESSTQVVNQTTTPEPTAEERELNQLELERVRATQPGQIQTQQSGLNLINQLLSGEEPLPGFFQQLSDGISPELTSEIAQESVRDLLPSFQSSGILNSGVAAEIAGRTAGDIRRATGEFNLGNKFNLLNLALSGQAQVQQPLLAQSQILSSRLAGLRPVTTSGTTNTTTTKPNPFLTSFQQSLGQNLGSAAFKAGPFSFGG